jgi:hypothetical protein
LRVFVDCGVVGRIESSLSNIYDLRTGTFMTKEPE